MDSAGQEVLKALEKGEIPRFLYKYRSLCDPHTTEIITDLSFWFAKPDSFNDPFDCRLSEVNSHKPKDIARFIWKPELGLTKAEFKSLARKNPEFTNKLAIKARNIIFGERGILSLSKVHDNILMWSHYASSHTGIVIALDIKKDPSFFNQPLKVKYQKSYSPINTFIDHENDERSYIYKMFATKSIEWKYEKEIRISKEKNALYSINPMAICGIYFGCNVSKKEKNNFIKLCKIKKMDHLKFYQGKTLYGQFGLIFQEIKTY